MARRMLNRHELRAAVEAAEARGIKDPDADKPRSRGSSAGTGERRAKAAPAARMRVVWAVCDVGGRTVATFDYADKADAEALLAKFKQQGKGTHFLRSLKEPYPGS